MNRVTCLPYSSGSWSLFLCDVGVGLIWAELGKVYREQGYVIRGVEAFEKAYNIYKQFYVYPDHPEVSIIPYRAIIEVLLVMVVYNSNPIYLLCYSFVYIGHTMECVVHAWDF